ncbi:alpha/beta fold hydrolase [Rhodoblastus acidophilus]|uniref:Alpha/beta fold hydrolase n=1 Tax=Candidatus Rhodoblastus alkanivorans TaxID=2954117 RepID=A0ABS9Z4B5_9HYPH|nr:alpha/beta fold hydrolase [Candidatus Rhodoblastus alkanivorans]MCI4680886.1 alpha/beta fold hydrolase [Candidatus Rhodoblastus alkanivorans]MCI4682311.1 alpha/beta fold hydrolase [Candidatus Rhodoblastus alkanivorans]MDI4639613.1 alpha/beta fold hydrolase [Rhodoblastus acidophilus]
MPGQNIAFLLAPGAGAPSSHPRMQMFARLLGRFGSVHPFDYPYMIEGRKSPDRLPHLIEAHRAALHALRQNHAGPIILVGKSMGGRVGCHVALVEKVAAVVCLGYPLCGGGDVSKLRDQVLLELTTPAMFVQGTRDHLCPLQIFEDVRGRMSAPTNIHVVEGGDHSLLVSKTALKARGITQENVDLGVLGAIEDFVRKMA